MLMFICSIIVDDEDIIWEDNMLFSKFRVLLLNLFWFGFSLMFFLLFVEGRYIRNIICLKLGDYDIFF